MKFYNKEDGIFYHEDQIKEGVDYIEITDEQHIAFIDDMNNNDKVPYVEGGEVKLKPREYTTEQLATRVRTKRDGLLTRNVDPIASNNLRWAELSQEQKDELSAYRQQLLDVPQQEGFPQSVIYPAVPSFV